MNQPYLLSDVIHLPGLIFIPLYGSIIFFLLVMLFKNRADLSLQKLFISVASLGCVLLWRGGDLVTLVLKFCIFTTPFIFMMFQKIGVVREGIKPFFLYMSCLWGTVLFVELFYYLGWLDLHFYSLVFTVFLVLLNIALVLYFFFTCSLRYASVVPEISRKVFNEILGIIVILVISAHIVILAVSGGNNLYTFLPAFTALFSLHAVLVYIECYGILAGKNKERAVKRSERDYQGTLEDSNISDEASILFRLINLFEEEKLYLNPEITVSDVASKIYTNRTYLSRALNQRTSKNFNQFVNYYRIREICELFIGNPDLKIQHLYEQCGFNSLSSFSSAFRLNTGYTPAEWAREVRRKQGNNEKVSVKEYIM